MVVAAGKDIPLVFVIFQYVCPGNARGRLGIEVLYELELVVLGIEYDILEQAFRKVVAVYLDEFPFAGVGPVQVIIGDLYGCVVLS